MWGCLRQKIWMLHSQVSLRGPVTEVSGQRVTGSFGSERGLYVPQAPARKQPSVVKSRPATLEMKRLKHTRHPPEHPSTFSPLSNPEHPHTLHFSGVAQQGFVAAPYKSSVNTGDRLREQQISSLSFFAFSSSVSSMSPCAGVPSITAVVHMPQEPCMQP